MENVLESIRNWLEFKLSTDNLHGYTEFDSDDVQTRIDVITAVLDIEDEDSHA